MHHGGDPCAVIGIDATRHDRVVSVVELQIS